MVIDAGKLDRKLVIHRATVTRGPTGQERAVWTVLATIRAQRLGLKLGQEVALKPGAEGKLAGDALVATGRYLIRWRDDLAIGQQVAVDGGTYRITAIEEPDRRRSLILTVSA